MRTPASSLRKATARASASEPRRDRDVVRPPTGLGAPSARTWYGVERSTCAAAVEHNPDIAVVTRILSLSAALAGAAFLAGCEPNCARTCRKLLDCDLNTPGWGQQDCEAACQEQESLFETTWEDPELADGWGELKECIVDEECNAIDNGACYDERFYVF